MRRLGRPSFLQCFFPDLLGAPVANLNVMAIMERDARRPWISITINPHSDLRYDRSGGYFPVNYTITNVGKSPAINVNVGAFLISQLKRPGVNSLDQVPPVDSVDRKIATTCDRSVPFCQVLFPGVAKSGFVGIAGTPPPAVGISGFALFACAIYQLNRDPAPHLTVRVLGIAPGSDTAFDPKQPSIPVAQLMVFSYPIDASTAD